MAVLAAALMHASWNALVKSRGDRCAGLIGMSIGMGAFAVPALYWTTLPSGVTWAWLLASIILHTGYRSFLGLAYAGGDLAQAYPLARGVAPMLSATGSAIFFAEMPHPVEETQLWSARHDPFSMHRAAFEIRTYRLCRRVLMFHHVAEDAELGDNCLVRSTDLVYREPPDVDDGTQPGFTQLIAVEQRAYQRRSDGRYDSRQVPPVTFKYSEPHIDATLRSIPKTLREATAAADESTMLRSAFGNEVIDHYVHAARWEQGQYDRVVTDWELQQGFERY